MGYLHLFNCETTPQTPFWEQADVGRWSAVTGEV